METIIKSDSVQMNKHQILMLHQRERLKLEGWVRKIDLSKRTFLRSRSHWNNESTSFPSRRIPTKSAQLLRFSKSDKATEFNCTMAMNAGKHSDCIVWRNPDANRQLGRRTPMVTFNWVFLQSCALCGISIIPAKSSFPLFTTVIGNLKSPNFIFTAKHFPINFKPQPQAPDTWR